VWCILVTSSSLRPSARQMLVQLRIETDCRFNSFCEKGRAGRPGSLFLRSGSVYNATFYFFDLAVFLIKLKVTFGEPLKLCHYLISRGRSSPLVLKHGLRARNSPRLLSPPPCPEMWSFCKLFSPPPLFSVQDESQLSPSQRGGVQRYVLPA
jgi:hypothetical protein